MLKPLIYGTIITGFIAFTANVPVIKKSHASGSAHVVTQGR